MLTNYYRNTAALPLSPTFFSTVLEIENSHPSEYIDLRAAENEKDSDNANVLNVSNNRVAQ